MYLSSFKSCAVALVAALLVTGTVSAADAPVPAHKWRVEFTGQSTAAGEMQFRVSGHEGEPLMVTVKINSGRGAYLMAQDLFEALKAQLPKKRFGAEIVHGQEVLVKPHSGEPDFVFELVESSVTGARVHITPA